MTDADIVREALPRCPAHHLTHESSSLCPACLACGNALAALTALEQELDALADVAFAGNAREKLLEADNARLIEMHARIANLNWPDDDFHVARAIARAALGKEPTA